MEEVGKSIGAGSGWVTLALLAPMDLPTSFIP
jgi:hypothetical protein